MNVCPSCGHDNQPGARFCSQCGNTIAVVPAAGGEERKVVTVLFADLVGFTSRAERLDPEDVRALLSPYYARLRREIERFGGTVEKFIGDAVMAVFGAPVAHEDDAERAVRASLAIRDWVNEQDATLQLRIAVNTGEALVSLGARPSEGEGMVSGDVVNTTSRLQTAAPVNGILVGEITHRATSAAISYREAEPVAAKGKSEPVRVWEALEARASFGVDLTRTGGPLIGREHELRVVVDALSRVRRERSPQLVTIVGVPGIGKSRLVSELFHIVDVDPSGLVYWRQGRSLPYGEGVTFWALAEMVKAQAGILETDASDEAGTKLHAAVRETVAEPDEAQWIEEQLHPLVGLGALERSGDRQGEAFAAWRRFFECLAERRPLVLVFEDLQWADDSLLDFVEHLVDWGGAVPLLVLCATRPELLERRSGWGGGARNATTLSLSPLTEEETARLISSLSDRPVMSVETQQALVERAGGNPLYAEQYVRMQAERGSDAGEFLPDTVQGIIAARIDALSAAEKRLVQDAAVIGKVFWLGGVAAVGQLDRGDAERLLHALERKDFVQRARRSSTSGDVEFAFQHVLVRDVAYGQIPRAVRAGKHRRAAEWLEELGRVEDHAEMLAHHYMSAMELQQATGDHLDAAFAQRVLASLRDAGDRAFALNVFAGSARYYEGALRLAPAGSRDHALLLSKLGRARFLADESDAGLVAAARDELVACGETEAAAEAALLLAEITWLSGDSDRAFQQVSEAQGIAAALPSSRATAHVLGDMSRFAMLASRPEALELGRQALALADVVDDDRLRCAAMNTIGVARVDANDAGGLQDLENAIATARASGDVYELSRAQGNYAASLFIVGRLREGREQRREAGRTAARFGQTTLERWFLGQVRDDFVLGDWDTALASANEFLAGVESGQSHYLAAPNYVDRAWIRMARDEVEEARADCERALDASRRVRDPQNRMTAVMGCAGVFHELGDDGRAAALASEALPQLAAGGLGTAMLGIHIFAFTAAALGRGAELVAALARAEGSWPDAARAVAAGDLRRAAAITGAMGAAGDEAYDRLSLAQALVKEGLRADADGELQRSLDFYRSVRATHFIRQAEALRAASA